MSSKTYWNYNLPLQVWPQFENPNDPTSPVVGTKILNYMPRKEALIELDLKDVLYGQSREEFFETAALHFENMARIFREAIKDPKTTIYYPDKGMDK